jgi:asparagine synthase (glutamine-hydrolysing)
MCGICGKYKPSGVQLSDLEPMLDAIRHRGPDDEGYYINGPVGLGSRRLSIIDIGGGRMPISNEDDSLVIVYNGEIYNYQFLRQTLQEKGHRFKTHTDTEVIIHLSEEFQERCVENLQGMFAFAIWDKTRKKLFLARDRIGQKPLFYTHCGEDFIFASEVKAILSANQYIRHIDFQSVYHYLSMRFIPSPGTMFRQIRKLPPGHYMTFQKGETKIIRYWDLDFTKKKHSSEIDFAEGLKNQIKETVKSHLISDVDVGAFLSGGLDSSTIVAMMADISFKPVNTFSIGVKEQDFNELPYARKVADHCRTNHFENCVAPDLITSLPSMIWHLDEPSDPIAACMFQAAELAARHVKVVLGGDGGDELFGGFDRYLGLERIHLYGRIPTFIRKNIIGFLLSAFPENFAYKSITQKIHWAQKVVSLPNDANRYAEASFFFRFNQHDKNMLLEDTFLKQFAEFDSAEVLNRHFNSPNAENLIDKMIYTDLMTRLPEHTLMLTDRLSMAHGLEARSPFLDHRLVEYLARFPANLKVHGRQLKYILRKMTKDILPYDIVKREKQGFMFPIAYWFRNELYVFIHNILLDSFFVKEGLFKKERVLRLLTDHKTSKIDNHVRLWMLLNLELWYRIYIQHQTPEQVSEEISDYS